jgi:photosynthetic reaction center cytochrome c subunit
MNTRGRGTVLAIGTLAALALATAQVRAQSAPAQGVPAGAGAKTAGEAFKNIQVLKDAPADQLMPAMQFISASLGVECEHCHVDRAPEKDDKEPKRTARKMMQMVMAINRDNFDGRREVTCYSCHRSAAEPVGIPLVAEEGSKPEPERAEAGGAKPAALPPADQLLEKYVQAMGGADTLQKISSRIEKGTLSFGDRHVPVEVFAKAPSKRLTVTHMANGDSMTAYDGRVGWLGNTGRPVHEMTGAETDAFKLDADFYFPVHVKQVFSQFRVRPQEKIGDHEAYLVLGLRQSQPPVRLYFDEQSGLLVRLVRYAETPLGRLPTQIDYADYRDADGVKLPFRWTLARPGGRFTIQIDSIQQNVPIDDAKFAEPAAPSATGQKPPAP